MSTLEKTIAPGAAGAIEEKPLTDQSVADVRKVCAPLSLGNWGAAPEDWVHFDLVLGLADDLLPVVSNPNSEISPNSSLTERGKAPSEYNGKRQIRGIPAWASLVVSEFDLKRWARDPDYGICVRTDVVRGLDVDVTDPELAQQVRTFVARELGLALPCRYRGNSSKFLHPFRLSGEYGKRVIYCQGNNKIEFLMTGQQFVAVGTHPSGARYEWVGGLPLEIPTLTPEQFERLFNGLQHTFGTRESTIRTGGTSKRLKGEHLDIADPVLPFIEGLGQYLGDMKDGSAIVVCPWEHEHTMGNTGDGRTVYYPPGTNGIASPGFCCKHAHCEDRKLPEYLAAIGYREDVIDEFEVLAVASDEPDPLPSYVRTKSGAVLATKENVVKAVARADVCGFHLRLDVFRDEVMAAPPGTNDWRSFKDTDYTELCIRLERPGNDFKDISKEKIRDAVAYVADNNKFDSAGHWLSLQQWDGVPRVEKFLPRYFATEDTPYTRAVGLYLWTALAGRVLQPGIKADMVPVAVGPQGVKKSSTVAAIVPSTDFFLELDLGSKDDDLARLMRGKLVIELGELKGLRAREVEHVKSFITRQYEEWTPKYREMQVRYARRCVFFGTTNKDEFLADDTGHRRWLPFRAGDCDPQGVADARGQLWAEARELFKSGGVQWFDAERLARAEHDAFVVRDAWEELVGDWLMAEDELTGSKPLDRPFRAVDALLCAVQMKPHAITQSAKDRMARVLKEIGPRFGFAAKRGYIDGKRARVYERTI